MIDATMFAALLVFTFAWATNHQRNKQEFVEKHYHTKWPTQFKATVSSVHSHQLTIRCQCVYGCAHSRPIHTKARSTLDAPVQIRTQIL